MTTVPQQSEAEIIARVVERREADADWTLLARTAAADDSVWARLADALRDDARVRRALAPVLAVADHVGLPAPRPRTVGSRFAVRACWLAAGAVAALLVDAGIRRLGPTDAAPPPGTAPGTTVEELPRLVLEARPAADGRTTEVLLLRRIVERAAVDGIVQVGVDEHGDPLPAWIDAASLQGPRRF